MHTTVGSYRIERLLGEGGMGVVYAAYDERLERSVALKALRGNSTDPKGRERLWREARLAASVNHPNVCQIYDVFEVDGEVYLAMELLEGETLAARLVRGPVSVTETCSMGLTMLGALDALHRRHVIHRDLKPANVFLTPHGVKLVDFGVARTLPQQAGGVTTGLTAPGLLVGTPQYMAPEQLRSDPIDARADIFALGALLIEMLTGGPAFKGRSLVDTMHAVLYDAPSGIEGLNASLADVLRRAVAKAPADRYGSARAMADALRAVTLDSGIARRDTGSAPSHVAAGPVTRLVVLPFRLLRPDPEIEFLGASLADAITTSLSGVGSLVVRTSFSAALHGPTLDFEEIAKRVDVDVVLTGTLLRVGGKLRVGAQLVEVPSGTVLWSDTSQISLDDVFALQDDLARRIVSSLELPLTAREHRLLNRDVPRSARAYEWYLRGTRLGLDPMTWTEARKLLERCVAEDREYAPAWARLARVYRLESKYNADSSEADMRRAEAAFRRALEINPDLSLAHTGYAALEVELGRPIHAMELLLERARMNPNDATLFAGLVHALRYCGLLDASIAAQHRARLLDPLIQTSVAHTYFMLGQYRRALEDSDSALDVARSMLLALMGRTDEAIAMTFEEEGRFGQTIEATFTQALRAALQGNSAETIEIVDRFLTTNFRDPEGFFYCSLMLGKAGAIDRAVALLRRLVLGGFYVPSVLKANAWLAPVRGHPEFPDIVGEAEARHRQGVDAYAAFGGPALLKVDARTQTSPG
jgi:eukaryotic-like serine/threonine-protein kinase